MQRPTRSEKKQLKRERIKEKYAQEKIRIKEAKRVKRENAPLPEPSEFLSARSEKTRMDREDFILRSERNATILIDCDFAEFMEPRELTSLTQQILQCYGIVRKLERPCRLALCGVSEAQSQLIWKLPGVSKWHFRCSGDLLGEETFPVTQNLLYLSADAEEDLEISSINRDTVIIVGGLVDRNRYKGLTHEKARDLGIRTARLPISRFVDMATSKVLTVNQVVEIVAEAVNAGEWEAVMKRVIPERKVAISR